MINDYSCTACGEAVGRKQLTVKKATFLEMGTGARTIRSRVVGWLCDPCLKKDADWNREPFVLPRPAVRG